MMAIANFAPPGNTASEEDSSSTDRTINSSDHNVPGFTTSTTSALNHTLYHHNEATVSIPVVLTTKLQSVNNLNYKMSRRVDCGDPVALTLWKGGEEDLPWLCEQDRRVVPMVSSNLSDIYGDTTTAELARPIPVLATRRSS
jgi:hypothetical protein